MTAEEKEERAAATKVNKLYLEILCEGKTAEEIE